MTGQVFKKVANLFGVMANKQEYYAVARGNLKLDGIFVGDIVEFELIENQPTIVSIHKRKNQLIRPPLANLDQLIIVIAQVPQPDFMIVDKLILFSLCYGINPIIVVNKQDIDAGVSEYVKKAYKNVVEHIIFTNAHARCTHGIQSNAYRCGQHHIQLYRIRKARSCGAF